jgi:hypothetical protein
LFAGLGIEFDTNPPAEIVDLRKTVNTRPQKQFHRDAHQTGPFSTEVQKSQTMLVSEKIRMWT